MLGRDEDRAVGIDGDVQGFTLSGERVRAQFAVAHAIGKEDSDRAAAAIGDVDGGSGIDSDIGGMQIAAIVLEGKAGFAAWRKLVDESSGGVGDVDDGFAVAGHGYGPVELAGAVASGAPRASSSPL